MFHAAEFDILSSVVSTKEHEQQMTSVADPIISDRHNFDFISDCISQGQLSDEHELCDFLVSSFRQVCDHKSDCFQQLQNEAELSLVRQVQVCSPKMNIPCVDAVGDIPMSGGRILNDLDDCLASSRRCVSLPNASAQDPLVTGKCTSAVCVNALKATSHSLDGRLDSCRVSSSIAATQEPLVTENCTPAVCINASKPISHNLRVVLDEDGIFLCLNFDKVKENISKLECALVGKLLGKRISFAWLQGELSRRWSHVGEFQLITIAPNCFICIFQSLEARVVILRGDPWIVADSIIGLARWSCSFSLEDMKGFQAKT
ncbi:hypothetical protein M5K25_018769 [Dendrobium thyrsiflorum]|uniref:DUF4283 domain-containing protein n=1 Tax=Dendrobium thyrsiflorum TaxID=117978 RepID=A0ABD0UD22_DENTH